MRATQSIPAAHHSPGNTNVHDSEKLRVVGGYDAATATEQF